MAASAEARMWEAVGHVRVVNGEERFVGLSVGLHPRTVAAMNPGRTVEPLVLVEDETGEYRGWLPSDGCPLRMVHHRQPFEMQFPYGSAAAVTTGQGEVILLRVEHPCY